MTKMFYRAIRRAPLHLAVLIAATAAAQGTRQNGDVMVDVGGHKLHARLAGAARPRVPAVVFESGFGATIDGWGSVPSMIAKAARVISYERAGIGTSEPGKEIPTVEHCATELHALLAKLAVPPPYVLVGHSWGGPLIHSFAAMFPSEIAGLVYVDPVDFTPTEADMRAVWDKAGIKNGHDILGTLPGELSPGAPTGLIAEAREIARVDAGGFVALRKDGDAPDVPTVFMLAGKEQSDDRLPSGDHHVYFEARLAQRIDHFGRLAAHLANGRLLLTSKSGHFIQLFQPSLVADAIVRTVGAATAHPDLDRLVGSYSLTKHISITISREDATLFVQLTAQQPLPMAAVSTTVFSLTAVAATIEFEVDRSGSATALVLVQNGARQRGEAEMIVVTFPLQRGTWIALSRGAVSASPVR